MPGIASVPDRSDCYTRCALCDLSFVNELELEEHLYSLLHHRALATEKGRDFVHECNLCFERCGGLSDYVSHLRGDKHKDNVERRKEDVDRNPRTTAVYGLAKYKDTFIHPPTSRHRASSLPSKPKDQAAHSPNLKKGQLYPPSSKFRNTSSSSMQRFSKRESIRFQHPPLLHYSSGHERVTARGSAHHQRFLSNPGDKWRHRSYRDNHWSRHDGVSREQDGNDRAAAGRVPNFASDSKRLDEPRIRPDRRVLNFPDSSETTDHQPRDHHPRTVKRALLKTPPPFKRLNSSLSGIANDRSMKKIKPDLTAKKDFLTQINKKCKKKNSKSSLKTSSTPSSDANSSSLLDVDDLRENLSTSSFPSVTSLSSSLNRNGKASTITSEIKTPGRDRYKFVRNKMSPKKTEKASMSSTTSSNTARNLSRQPNSSCRKSPLRGVSNTSSIETKEMRDRFRSIMDAIQPPQSTRSASSTAVVSSPSSAGFESTNTAAHKPVSCTGLKINEETILRPEQNSSTSRNPDKKSSLESPSKIRGQLLQLAQKKEKEMKKSNQINEKNVSSSSGSGSTQSYERSEDSSDATKKKDQPKPNLSKARSRLCNNKPTAACSNPSDVDADKHTRLANLMLRKGGRGKAHSTSGAKQSTVTEATGPRFGIGVPSRDTDKDFPLAKSDVEDIVATIAEAEGDFGNELDENKTQVDDVGTQPTAESTSTSEQNPSSILSPPPSKFSSKPSSSAPLNPKPAPPQPSSNVTSVNPVSQKNAPSESSVSSCRGMEDNLSLKLLHMSEREELLHSQDQEVKEKSHKLQEELSHVNQLINQLLDRKKELELASSKVDEETEAIKQEMDGIRQERLVLLRASADSSGQSKPTTPNRGKGARTGSSCQNGPIPPPNSSFPDSQSSISTSSTNPIFSGHPSADVKCEVSPQLPAPTFSQEPFPVSSESVYFDPNAASPSVKPMTSSMDKILSKYLKDAEREVTSTTVPETGRYSRCQDSQFDPSSTGHHEVSSTTPPQANPHKKKTTSNHLRPSHDPVQKNKLDKLPSDSNLAKLALEQSSKDITSSWVTAHEESFDRKAVNPSSVPIKLTTQQADVAALRAVTLRHHSQAVLAVYVTKCGQILSCSKDKTLCIADHETGRLLEKYHLPGIPFKTCFAEDDVSGKSLTIYVVFVNDANDRPALSESSLHGVNIRLSNNGSDLDPGSPLRMKKLLGHVSCIMSIHQSKDLLYLGARDGNVTVLSIKTGKVMDTLDCHSPHGVFCLTTGTDGARRVLCCGSSDCMISVRDASDGLLLKTLVGHSKTVNCLQLSKNLVYSGASDRSVLVHNIHTGDVICRFLGMHVGTIKDLQLCDDAIVTMCLDKSIRVLRSEPCRVSGPVKALPHLPFSMFISIDELGGPWGATITVPLAYVGCQDGAVLAFPLTQLARKVDSQDEDSIDVSIKEEVSGAFSSATSMSSLQCRWNNCEASGFTNPSSLLTHISLFHATDSYKEALDSCCLWGDCTHYFSSDLDTGLDVHIHMDKHVSDEVQKSRHA